MKTSVLVRYYEQLITFFQTNKVKILWFRRKRKMKTKGKKKETIVQNKKQTIKIPLGNGTLEF